MMRKCDRSFIHTKRQHFLKGVINVLFIVCLFQIVFLCESFVFTNRQIRQKQYGSNFDHKSNQSLRICESSQKDSINSQKIESSEATIVNEQQILTSAVLKISYDGAHFYGWSAANDGQPIQELSINEEEYDSRPNGASFLPPLPHQAKGRRSRKRKGSVIRNIHVVRSVEGTLKAILAKIYGNVDKDRIVLEGSSRTDKGVHANGMIALAYCLKCDYEKNYNVKEATYHEKKKPHPSSLSDNTCFEPLPFNSDLSKLMFVLNRMLPPDLRVISVSPMPTGLNTDSLPFHPSCHSIGKTYLYTFTLNNIHDPLRWRHVWHVEEKTKGKKVFDTKKAQAVANLFAGSHDFSAFRGAVKSKTDKAKFKSQKTICTIETIQMKSEDDLQSSNVDLLLRPQPDYMVGFNKGTIDERDDVTSSLPENRTFQISITGDRFLYKMVRFIVGTIVAAGLQRVSEDEVKSALENGSWSSSYESDGNINNNKSNNIFCAPSHVLVLEKVYYPDEIQFHWKQG